jgi:nicotinate-nucleotide--dimethylbenzimidazole phosphoribosyltransferase
MLNNQFDAQISQRIDQKTKPPGALGQLEGLAFKLAKIQSQSDVVNNIQLSKPTVLVFAADHGVAQEGVSIAPSEVTQQMVMNFLSGGAAINCFCRSNELELIVIDCGMLNSVDDDSGQLVLQRLGAGTKNFAQQAAMSAQQLEQGLAMGSGIVNKTIASGCNVLMFGEMGIGNTSSASAILAALLQLDAQHCVGLGTGITPEQLQHKLSVVSKGAERVRGMTPHDILCEVGGFEIVQMIGAFLAAAENNTPVLVDGFIVSVAALVASRINPDCTEYMIFAHRSQEAAHQAVLSELDAQPLLDLGLRLGEGTGAALAYPLVKAAAEFYNHMASFESAGVTV